MSWEVGDDEWLAAPTAGVGAGPVDPLDDRVIRALSSDAVRRIDAQEPAAEPTASFELPAGSLPPPPYSAAFDADGEAPSYESGSFVADPEPDSPIEDEPEVDFHIPVLTLGGTAQPSATEPHSSSDLADPEPAAFVIPTLSAAPARAAVVDDGVEEVEAEVLEEVEDSEHLQPIRTGDTVITRAPDPGPEPDTHSVSSVVTESVYDDDDDDQASALVIPELVDRIDSSELELEPEITDETVESTTTEPASDVAGDSAGDLGFVIPTLARPESSVSEHPGDDLVIPPTAADPTAPIGEEAGDAAVDEAVDEDAEDLQEVDAESIESLDAADLEELEQLVAVAAAVESAEPKPPAPPEAKAQTKRRKGWYDDVFGDHFLFLYPLTWSETCQRDAQFIFSQLGGREGMSLLDVGCGDGSHAVELAKLGVRVTGVDNSLALLLAAAQNKESAELEAGRVEFIHGDMRRLPRDREFDAVICVGTTLGYFEEDQNWHCLQEMHDRLLPGGRLLINVFNRDFVAPHLPSRSWWQGTRCMVIDEAEMNFFANRLRVHRTIIFDDGRQYEHYMFMRAYTVQDLGKAISQLGMRVIQVSGSRDTVGRFYGSASPDIWIVAEKK